MQLKEYLTRSKLIGKKFAKIAGLRNQQVFNAMSGRQVGLITALKIQRASYGQVTPYDLLTKEIKEKHSLVDFRDMVE